MDIPANLTSFAVLATIISIAMAMVYFLLARSRVDQERQRRLEIEVARLQYSHEQATLRPASGDESAANTVPHDSGSANPYGGYVFVDVPDDYKALFHDTIKGFEEYARLKGYRVSIAIDTTPPGKVGFKFTILDRGVTVSTSTVKSHVDEYIAQLTESETFDGLPIVIDPIEHERLKAVLTTRFSMIKSNAEMHRAEANFYKQLTKDMAQMRGGGVGYLPAPPTVINNQVALPGARMANDSYSADYSPGAAVGKGNTAIIEQSRITIEPTPERRGDQIASLTELIALVAHSELDSKDEAVRHLSNVREELSAEETPDSGVVAKYLNKAKEILALAETGSDILNKTNEVLGRFGWAGLT